MDSAELSTSVRRVISALHKGLRKQMYSADTYSMTEIETIRHLLRHTSLLPSELATLTRIKTQSMSQILNKMEKQGVILKTPCTEDKRKVYISLTSFGNEKVDEIKYHGDEWLKHLIEESLTPEEQELLAKALPLLNKLIETKK
ncbi:MAG TPA: MarR family transcriptional regulator [Paludibacter sp.]